MKETEIKKGGAPPFPSTEGEPKTAKLPETPPTPAAPIKKGVPDASKVGPIASIPLPERVEPIKNGHEEEGEKYVWCRCPSCTEGVFSKFPEDKIGKIGFCRVCGADIKICDTKLPELKLPTTPPATVPTKKWWRKKYAVIAIVALIAICWIAGWIIGPIITGPSDNENGAEEPASTVQALDEALRKELAEAKVALTVAVKNGEDIKAKLAKAELDLANADLAQKTAKITLSNILQEKEDELRIVKAMLAEANEANDAVLDLLDVPEGGGMSLQKLEIDGVEGFLFRVVQTATTSPSTPSTQRQVAPPPPEQ